VTSLSQPACSPENCEKRNYPSGLRPDLIGLFAGGFIATKIAVGENGFLPSVLVGVLLTIAGLVNFFVTMPGSPMWVIVLCLAIYIPFSLIGHRAAK
jgi:hypothetical protein